MIRLGYAALNTQLPSPNRGMRLASYTEERMLERTRENLAALLEVLRWNAQRDIRVFRVGSKLVPFGSHPVNSGSWRSLLAADFERVGSFAREQHMRLSMHPGQHTVLNTPWPRVLEATLAELDYHATVLELFGCGPEGTIVLHCGGAYGDLTGSLDTLERRYCELPRRVRRRLAFENDERVCSAEIVRVCERLNAPAILDVFHHRVLPSFPEMSERGLVEWFGRTWPNAIRQKIHYSSQAFDKTRGAHADCVDPEEFAAFYAEVSDCELDIMLEAKLKERSLLEVRERLGG